MKNKNPLKYICETIEDVGMLKGVLSCARMRYYQYSNDSETDECKKYVTDRINWIDNFENKIYHWSEEMLYFKENKELKKIFNSVAQIKKFMPDTQRVKLSKEAYQVLLKQLQLSEIEKRNYQKQMYLAEFDVTVYHGR